MTATADQHGHVLKIRIEPFYVKLKCKTCEGGFLIDASKPHVAGLGFEHICDNDECKHICWLDKVYPRTAFFKGEKEVG